MARGQATEEELSANLASLGGVGGLTAGRLRRDGPFASIEGGRVAASQAAEARIERTPVPAPRNAPTAQPDAQKVRAETSEGGRPTRTQPTAERPAVKPSAPRPKTASSPEERTEPVSVPMTCEMRAKATAIARELQYRREDKSHRFTANSVFRAAIEAVLEAFVLSPEDRPNTEEEWRSLVRSGLARGRPSRE